MDDDLVLSFVELRLRLVSSWAELKVLLSEQRIAYNEIIFRKPEALIFSDLVQQRYSASRGERRYYLSEFLSLIKKEHSSGDEWLNASVIEDRNIRDKVRPVVAALRDAQIVIEEKDGRAFRYRPSKYLQTYYRSAATGREILAQWEQDSLVLNHGLKA